MKRYFSLYAFILIIFLAAPVLGQEKWFQKEGRYVYLEYNSGHAQLADSMINIADRALPKLAALHGVKLDLFLKKKVRIILTDTPDISNGFALGNTIVIYGRSSYYMQNWDGPHAWYKMVLSHELAHHVSYRAFERFGSKIGFLNNVSTPRWFYEGSAQYFTETWRTFRGEVYLQHAVLNGNLTYNSLHNLNDGRLLYASGHAFTRYLAQQYGDSSLIKLMRYNKDDIYYDFNDAFKAVYSKTPRQIFAHFLRHMIIYYGHKAAQYPVLKYDASLLTVGYFDTQITPLNNADSTWLVATYKKRNHLYKTAYIYSYKKKKLRLVEEITHHFSTKLYMSKNDKYIAWGRPAYALKNNLTAIGYNWYIYNREQKHTKLIASNTRSQQACFTEKNDLLLAVNEADSGKIVLFTNPFTHQNAKKDVLYSSPMPIGNIIAGWDKSYIFEAQAGEKQRDLYHLNNKVVRQLTFDKAENRNPLLIDATHLLFNKNVNDKPVIASLNLETGEIKNKVNVQYPIWLENYNAKEKKVITSHKYTGSSNIFVSHHVDSLFLHSTGDIALTDANGYGEWQKIAAQTDSIEYFPGILKEKRTTPLSFPQGKMENLQNFLFPSFNKRNGTGLYAASVWYEPLGRQSLIFSGFFSFKEWDRSFVLLNHGLNIYNLNINTSLFHGPGIFTRVGDKFVRYVHDFGQLTANYTHFINGNDRTKLNLALGYKFDMFERYNKGNASNYHGPLVQLSGGYLLPSRYHFVFPKRQAFFATEFFKSLNSDADFSVLKMDLKLGSTLFLENVGIVSRFKYTKIYDALLPTVVTGIDQDYHLNIPRDFRNTRTIRGVDRDLFGDELTWNSTELSWFIAENPPLYILLFPIQDLALTAFADGAIINGPGLNKNLKTASIGSEISFGFNILRFSVGVARGFVEKEKLDDSFYIRFSTPIDHLLGNIKEGASH